MELSAEDFAKMLADINGETTSKSTEEETKKTEENVEAKPITENSIFVGNLSTSVTPEKLEEFFSCCGAIKKITIPKKAERHPKKYAYIEFTKKEAVELAMGLNNTAFLGNNIQVKEKRDNEPGRSRRRIHRIRKQ